MRIIMNHPLSRILSVFLILLVAQAASAATVEQVLKMKKAPPGVVFEIVAGSKGLRWAIPQIQASVMKLRKRFPGLEIAVVSHGSEQFALQKKHSKRYSKVHKQVQDLAGKQGIPVHICQTHASWRGVQAEDFPSYVTVSATGPAQIRDYRSLGYVLIVLRRR